MPTHSPRRSPPRTWRRLRARCLTTAVILAALGCGGKQPPEEVSVSPNGDVDPEEARFTARWPRDAIVPVEIQNRHTLDLTIYVIQSGRSQRVAMATAVTTTFIRLPVRHLGPGNELRLMAHAIGAARRLQSERLVVMPGQRVVWTIDNGFHHESSAVWE